MQYSIVIDFDGTITTEDVAELILIHHAHGDWKTVEERAVAGEITMDQCMIEQYEMINGNPEEIMATGKSASLRDGFFDFYRYFNQSHIDMICISAGLSFLIESIFAHHGIELDVIAPKADLSDDGIDLELVPFPDDFTDFKHYHVKRLQEEGRKVIYIGDGTSDYGGIIHADRRYTVSNSSLSRLCDEQGLAHTDFDSFSEIKEDLHTYLNL